MRRRLKRVVILFDAREPGPPPPGGYYDHGPASAKGLALKFGSSAKPPMASPYPLRGALSLGCGSVLQE